jgi:uncharacterized protein (TIGR02246 family)
MKKYRSFVLAIAVLLMISCSDSVSESNSNDKNSEPIAESTEDRKAIETAYDNWYTAWEKKDYKLAAQDYSDDAIWVNAFGMRRVGREEIEKTLKEVFAMDFVMAGESKTVEKTVKFIKPDVALVTSLIEREGQEMPSGEKMNTRKTSHLRVFVKSNGKWQIVSHLISDARDTERAER